MSKQSDFKVHFIGVGAAKCGTTWLNNCLAEHPQIQVTKTKEVQFFNKHGGIFDKFYGNRKWNYEKGLSWYRKQFSDDLAGKVAGEFSVDYLYDENTAELIHENFPDAKILVCLREPVSRTYSHYCWFRYKFGYEKDDFETALDRELEYIDRSKYYPQLKRYYDVFPQQHIKVILHDDICSDPQEVLRDVYTFLGVAPNFVPSILKKRVNAGMRRKKGVLSSLFGIADLLRTVGLRPVLTALEKTAFYSRFARMYRKLTMEDYKAPPLDEQSRAKLKKLFQSDIKKTSSLVGRDLSMWL